MELYRLNYPIETTEALKFWSSNHKCNRMKAIMAFSLDLKNANDNYKRYGYTRAWRTKAIAAFKLDVNKPSMSGMQFYELGDTHWSVMPHVPGAKVVSEDSLEGWISKLG